MLWSKAHWKTIPLIPKCHPNLPALFNRRDLFLMLGGPHRNVRQHPFWWSASPERSNHLLGVRTAILGFVIAFFTSTAAQDVVAGPILAMHSWLAITRALFLRRHVDNLACALSPWAAGMWLAEHPPCLSCSQTAGLTWKHLEESKSQGQQTPLIIFFPLGALNLFIFCCWRRRASCVAVCISDSLGAEVSLSWSTTPAHNQSPSTQLKAEARANTRAAAPFVRLSAPCQPGLLLRWAGRLLGARPHPLSPRLSIMPCLAGGTLGGPPREAWLRWGGHVARSCCCSQLSTHGFRGRKEKTKGRASAVTVSSVLRARGSEKKVLLERKIRNR